MPDPEALMHAQMKAVVAKAGELAAGRPAKAAWTVEQHRRFMRDDQTFWSAEQPEVAVVRDDAVAGPYRPIPVRLLAPSARDGVPLIVFFHGGGWVKGDLDTHERVGRLIARAADAAVILVDYALAPEHPFPTPYEECVAAVEGILADRSRWGIDPTRVVLAGDSAGGNLALATMLALRERRPGTIKAGLLFYGAFDTDLDTASYHDFGGGDFPPLTRDDMAFYWNAYLPAGVDRTDPYAAPIHGDFTGLPPLFLCAAGLDCLRDDTFKLAERLTAAGVPFEQKVYAGVGHGFIQFSRLLDAANDAIRDAAAFAKKVL